MALGIVDRTFGGSDTDRAAQLANVELHRPISLANDWTTLAFGVQINIEAAAAISLGATGFGIGLSNNQPFMQPSTSNFVGVRIGDNTTDLADTSGYFVWNNMDIVTKVGETITVESTPADDIFIPLNGTADKRANLVIIVTKDTNYTVSVVFPDANTFTDTSEANFLAALETLSRASMISDFGTGYAYVEDTGVAVDEGTNGILNTLNVWWPAVSSKLNCFITAGVKWA